MHIQALAIMKKLSMSILLICIRTIFVERRFESLPSLIIFIPLLILPIFLQIFSTLALLIKILSLSNGLSQSFGLIILNLIFIERWKSTEEPLYFHLFILDKPRILQQSQELIFIFSHGHPPHPEFKQILHLLVIVVL